MVTIIKETSDQIRLGMMLDFAKSMGFSIKFKNTSRFMKLIGTLLFFNKAFMTRYVTTIGKTIYYPSEEDFLDKCEKTPKSTLGTIAHEMTHGVDSQNDPFFSFQYLMPQLYALLSLLALGAIWGSMWWLGALVFLGFLLPIGSVARTKAELRGYGMSVAVMCWQGRRNIEEIIEKYYIPQFTGMAYYRMCSNADLVRKELVYCLTMAENGTLGQVLPLADKVRDIIQGELDAAA